MFVNKSIAPLLVDADESILSALKKIEANKHKIVFVVDSKNHLVGSFADGDFRRWVLNNSNADLSGSVGGVCNKDFFHLDIDCPTSEINRSVNSGWNTIPLVDKNGHIIAVAENKARFFTVANKRISDEDPAFIIAEIGNNHQGDIELAKKLIWLAAQSGVDCIKFQMRDMNALYGESVGASTADQDLGSQYTLDLLARYQLTNEELVEVFDYCKSLGTIPLCTPWDLPSLRLLEEYGMPAYKVASADFTNYELLAAIAETGKPMFCSTGMADESEIKRSIEFLERKKAQYLLLHCNSTYPTPFKDVNLRYLNRLKDLSDTVVGYSGHERGWAIPIAAVAMGARVIEKHFTIDKGLEGNDHKVSLLPDELTAMVRGIRDLEEGMGVAGPREITQGELINREVLAKSIHVLKAIKKGETIKADSLVIRGPGKGLQPNRLNELIGKTAFRDLDEGDVFYESDITGHYEQKQSYNFSRPYGIPVRYHDYNKLTKHTKLDFVEFHLSYQDLDMDFAKYVKDTGGMDVVVHAPELFANDHLIDLASYDDDYRLRSIDEMKRVVTESLELRSYFSKSDDIQIVLNAGGWNESGFITQADKEKKYAILARSLEQLRTPGVQFCIQTMPPFPWHFGGQSFHNLFVFPNEIAQFCRENDHNVCFDVSHSMMACNYYKLDLLEFTREIAAFVKHMHIVDAKGVDGEGVQMGEGDVDFKKLARVLDDSIPDATFLPEVWQGHKNNGEGFWKALAFLERKFSEVN